MADESTEADRDERMTEEAADRDLAQDSETRKSNADATPMNQAATGSPVQSEGDAQRGAPVDRNPARINTTGDTDASARNLAGTKRGGGASGASRTTTKGGTARKGVAEGGSGKIGAAKRGSGAARSGNATTGANGSAAAGKGATASKKAAAGARKATSQKVAGGLSRQTAKAMTQKAGAKSVPNKAGSKGNPDAAKKGGGKAAARKGAAKKR